MNPSCFSFSASSASKEDHIALDEFILLFTFTPSIKEVCSADGTSIVFPCAEDDGNKAVERHRSGLVSYPPPRTRDRQDVKRFRVPRFPQCPARDDMRLLNIRERIDIVVMLLPLKELQCLLINRTNTTLKKEIRGTK